MSGSDRAVFPALIGNDKIKKLFSADIEKDAVPHAYIIEGAYGSGKYTAARQIAAACVCEHRHDRNYPLPCGKCVSCRRILSCSSVDVLTIERDKDKQSIGVEFSRIIKESLYIPPNDGEKKFYIVREAHLLTPQAQNALLLSLEEPPEYVMFLLLAEKRENLLETVRSRAPAIETERFDAAFIEDYLIKKRGIAKENAVYAAHLASGSLGRAAELSENGEEESVLYNTALEFTRCLLTGKRSEAIMLVKNSFPKKRADVCTVISLTRNALRDSVASKRGGELLFYSEVPDYTRRASLGRIIKLCALLSDAEVNIGSLNCSPLTSLSAVIMAEL